MPGTYQEDAGREEPRSRPHDMGGTIGPADEAERGAIDDEDPTPDDPDAGSGVTAALNQEHQHVTAGLEWSDGDKADPDGGSGRTGT